MDALETKLGEVLAEIKTLKESAAATQKTVGSIPPDLVERLTSMQTQYDALDKKLAERHAAAQPPKSLYDTLKENEKLQSFLRDQSGSVRFDIDHKHMHELERKTSITSDVVGISTSGVLQIDRTPGIVEEARQELKIRDIVTSRPTTMQKIDFVKVNSPMTAASPQYVEGHTKKENAVTFTVADEDVVTLATWIPASTQILDDFNELMAFLRNSLSYYVNLKEEQDMLSGSGAGMTLHGWIPQAQAFDTSLLSASAGWNKIDQLGRASQQIEADKEVPPNFVVLHPNDAWDIRLKKDSYGRYIVGDPMGGNIRPTLFNLRPIVTTSITSGTFLVGSSSPAVTEIRDRMGMTVEIARQHSTYFTENMVAIKAEKRLALVTYRPDAFVTGTFTTSP